MSQKICEIVTCFSLNADGIDSSTRGLGVVGSNSSRLRQRTISAGKMKRFISRPPKVAGRL